MKMTKKMKMACLCLVLLLALGLGLCDANADEAGSIRLDWFSGGAMGMRFTEVVVDAEAETLSIWPNRTVKNVTLEKMDWFDGSAPLVLFTAETLESNQVINLRAYLSDVLPDFRVTCEDENGEKECWYITMSGEDGSLLLLPPEAVAPVVPVPFTLSALENIGFTFSSGVGAWRTDLRVAGDGSFLGGYHDSEMGENAADYPNGTVYGCLFHGQMRLEETEDEAALRLVIERLEPDEGQLPEAIEDGIRYVTTEPYGLTGTDELLLYLPGTPVDALPEGFLLWAHGMGLPAEAETLPCYGLYNAAEDAGFMGFPLAR